MNMSTDEKVSYFFILLGSLITLFMIGMEYNYQNELESESNDEIIESIEYMSDEEELRENLVLEVDSYISHIAPTSKLDAYTIVRLCEEYDIDICFVLAQGQVESHFGTKGLAKKTNSVFNVMAYDGHSYEKIRKKGKYETPNCSIEPYIRLLKQNYLIDKCEKDLLYSFVDVNNRRYASNKKYEQKLRNVYYTIRDTTKIGQLEEELKTINI